MDLQSMDLQSMDLQSMDLQSFINQNKDNYIDLFKQEKLVYRKYPALNLLVVKRKYGSAFSTDKSWLNYCRGAIIDYSNHKVVLVPPVKSSEIRTKEEFMSPGLIDDEYQYLIDGTMINMFYHNNEWLVSTRSNIGARCKFNQDCDYTFRYMFLDAMNAMEMEFAQLDKEVCYSFVLQHPQNRIVVPILKPYLYLVRRYKCMGNKVDDISVTFNKLRTELHNASQNAFKTDSNAGNAYKKIRDIITNAQRNQLSTKGDKMAWDALTKASEDFKIILGQTTVGKDFAAILEKMKQVNYNRTKTNPEGVPDPNHELADALEKDVDILVSKMLEKIIDTKHSFPLLLQFEKAMNAIDYRTNNINKVLNRKKAPEMETEMYAHYTQKNFKKYPELQNINISKFPINDYPQRIEKVISKLADERLTPPIGNESYPALKEIIRSRFGENLKQDISSLDQGGLAFIGKVLDRENGFDLVKHLYPEHVDDLIKIESLMKFLQ